MQIAAIAQTGVARALERFEASARRTADFGRTDAGFDYAREAVEQITAKQEFSANLAVLRTADDMMKQLLDLKV